ncbi:hypothetical protein N7486_002212 [Penicillium sp. IBT 16267x]|nr:hypothetical protein N7486_002212 [Penicillium sp. IBT 16267x]
MSNVVAQLHAVRKSNEIISYYFCRVDHEASLSARIILGSLAQENSRDLSTNEVIPFLLSHLEADKKYYVILDGLDDCEDHQIQAMAQALAKLCSSCLEGFKVLCAGRPGLEKQLFKPRRPQYTVTVNKDMVDLDIDHYITTILGKYLEEEVLALRDPMHITAIYRALRDKSNGMFLWVSLCIEELCAQNCDDDILEALRNLPRGLSELYDLKLRRVGEGRATREAMKVLQYCGVVKRPLAVTEYREALSLSLEQKTFDHGKIPNDMNKVIKGCYGLIFADEEEDTVHYVHHSVRQHLFITNGGHESQFDMASLDQHFGYLCMTYLDFSNFKRQLTKFKKGSGTPIEPVKLGTLPIYSSSGLSSKLAQKILSQHRKLRNLSAREIERTALEIVGDGESPRLMLDLQKQGFQFLNYARDYWLYHLSDFTEDVDNQGLWYAAADGCNLSLSTWLQEGADVSAIFDGKTALQAAAGGGHLEIVQVLLAAKADVNALPTTQYGQTALQAAAGGGYLEIVQALLAAEADVNASPATFTGQTALQAAAGGGHLEIHINAPPAINIGRTALQAAAGGGHLEIVQALLAAGADVNAPPANWDGRTALQAAAGGGHLKVVQALLAAGADVNASPAQNIGQTALQAAAGGGHLKVVEILTQSGAE